MYKKRPYEALYNHLVLRAKIKDQVVTLRYEEFLEFTAVLNCHYCKAKLSWNDYSLNRGRSAACNLDRMDNNLGYTKDNCVPCCTRCNFSKSDRYTFEEWYAMNEIFRKEKDVISTGSTESGYEQVTGTNEEGSSGSGILDNLFGEGTTSTFIG